MGADGGHPSEPCIWLVQGHDLSENVRAWRSAESFEHGGIEPEPVLKSMRQTKVGWFLPQDRFPADNYPRPEHYPPAHEQPAPQIFSNGFIFLAGESADVVRSFDMGEGAFYPVRLWHPDRKTLMPGEFFYLSQGNRKDAFLQERSDKEGIDAMSQGRWRIDIVHSRPPLLFFSESALHGPDIWWDKSIYKHFFISDRLKRGLDQRRLSRDWHLTRCPVVLD